MNLSARRSFERTSRKENIFQYIVKHKYMYLMLVPAILYYVVFCYLPMAGVQIAFKKFNPMVGIWASPWVGFTYFEKLFSLNKFYQVFWNTLSISLTRLIWGFPFPIIIALMLNELRHQRLKKFVQSVSYMPYFISTVVVCSIVINF
ncbi:MAG: sugar ABC transporter permease, partial [Clostridia bacterium]